LESVCDKQNLKIAARQAYCGVVPTMNLLNNLRPEANLHEQLKDVFSTMKDQMIFIKICQNTPQLCWGDEWPTLSPGGRGLG